MDIRDLDKLKANVDRVLARLNDPNKYAKCDAERDVHFLLGYAKGALSGVQQALAEEYERLANERRDTIDYQIELRRLAKQRQDRRSYDAGVPASGEIP